jgi:hypothetical protein
MKKQVVFVISGVAIVVLVGICFFQYQKIQRLNEKQAAVTQKVDPSAQVKNKQPSEKPEKKATAEVEPLETPVEAPPAQVGTVVVPASESSMKGIAEMMKSPTMKEMIRAQQKGQIEMMYGPLLKCLQLSDADMESFKNLLLDRQMALVDSSMDMMNNAATPEEKKAAADRIKELTATYDAQCKELLGDDNYALYKSYEETQVERMQVSMFKGSLTGADQLSAEQEDSLIRAMYEARTNFKGALPGIGDQQAVVDPSQFTPERMTQMLEESAKLQEQYIEKAATILTPSQLEQFKANQKQQQAIQEMGMKMATEMFGQGQAAPERPQPAPVAP